MPAPTPFTIAIPDTELDDLRSRLLNTRWPDEVEGLNWEAGIPLDVVKVETRPFFQPRPLSLPAPPRYLTHTPSAQQTLTTHWATAFNWRALEARLNARPQFKWGYADPDHPGARPLGIHFFHLRGRRAPAGGGGATPPTPRPAPVLMLHGWPGSFLEFEGVIEELTHPSDPALPGLDLVIPSLPGYGFSDAPAVAGWGVRKVARALNALMTTGLGLKAYNVQGGDWGALIGRALGTEWAASAGALHVNMPVARPRLSSPRTILQALNAPLAGYAPVFLTRAEAAGLRSGWNYATAESGYFRLQATRPQTLAYGLTDSPAGLVAWIGEKFGAWTDTAGEAPALPPGATPAERAAGRAAVRAKRLLEVFSLDHLVANVALYWHGRTAASSVRLYRETEACGDLGWLLGRSVAVPTGVLAMPFELFRPPRAWVAAHYNLARWTPATKGGHFAAMENPGEFIADVRAFFEAHGVREGV